MDLPEFGGFLATVEIQLPERKGNLSMLPRSVTTLVFATGILTVSWLTGQPTTATTPSDDRLPVLAAEEKTAIQSVLEKQVAAWNRADVTEFMQGYWNSPHLTFASGGNLTRGWQQTHDRYQDRYDTPEKMGNLRFDHLEYQSIAGDAALVLGQWHLTDADKNLMEGNFSLVMKKFGEHWRVIHDHTSLKPQE